MRGHDTTGEDDKHKRFVREFTKKYVDSPKRVPKQGRRDHWETRTPNFGLRVSSTGQRSYILYPPAWPSTGKPSRRTIGDAAKLPLTEARTIAKRWNALIEQGIDPQEQEKKRLHEERRNRATTFGAIAEDYRRDHLSRMRRGERDWAEIERCLLPRWRKTPAKDIARLDVKEMAKAVADSRGVPSARLALSHTSRIFSWAIDQETYGLDDNPCRSVSPKRTFGPKRPRQRTLDNDELRAFWLATERMESPLGECLRLIALTGCRRNEIAHARWPEYRRDERMIVIPPERFKSDAEHLVPLSRQAVEIMESLLPRPQRGAVPLRQKQSPGDRFVFTTTEGRKAINGWSKAKSDLDELMSKELGRPVEHWVIHDLRHVVRTRLAELRVPENVCEMYVGHGKRGLARVYDQHRYIKELREAAQKWADLIERIAAGERKVVLMAGRKS
jgi:integrase